jgi:hypothetical protein
MATVDVRAIPLPGPQDSSDKASSEAPRRSKRKRARAAFRRLVRACFDAHDEDEPAVSIIASDLCVPSLSLCHLRIMCLVPQRTIRRKRLRCPPNQSAAGSSLLFLWTPSSNLFLRTGASRPTNWTMLTKTKLCPRAEQALVTHINSSASSAS